MSEKRAMLIDLIPPILTKEDAYERMEELEELVRTFGGAVIVKKYQRRSTPNNKTFIGSGKVEEILQDGKAQKIQLLVLNHILKPRQIYALQEALRPAKIEVWDRIDLILKIFAKHASTTEARLEIELASIRHMGPRIYGMGMELSRQAGGIGTVGIGEKNTEIMKRHLREQEKSVREKLKKYANTRELQRDRRARQEFKTFALVGYTNAGKTSLFNRLTKRKEYAADKLFATLDTRTGAVFLPETQSTVLFSDTIGFIKNLPPELINAFEATLSEAKSADVIVHVVDASHPKMQDQILVVNNVLERLNMHEKPRVLVFNKMDLVSEEQKQDLQDLFKNDAPIFLSAHTGEGVNDLLQICGKGIERY